MSLVTQISSLATRIGTEFKAVRATEGSLSSLTTTDKTSLVGAINEVKAAGSSGGTTAATVGAAINGTSTKATPVAADALAILDSAAANALAKITYSSLTTAITASIVAGAPAALDTLNELSTALGGDANFAATTATALGNRLRVDTAAQGLTGTQQQNARTNIAVYSTTEVGDPTTDFVATFNAALV